MPWSEPYVKLLGPEMPPYDEYAEYAVLGSCLIDPTAISKVLFLKPADFFREKNRWCFTAMLAVHSRQEPTTQILVMHEMANHKYEMKNGQIYSWLDAAGGASYISFCVSQCDSTVFVKYYADIVKDMAERRDKLQQANKLTQEAYAPRPTRGRGVDVGVRTIKKGG